MPPRAALAHAAETLLTQCLELPADGELAIVADETTRALAELLATTATALGYQPYVLYFPTPLQRRHTERALPETVRVALNDANATILCVQASTDGLGFREQVRQAAIGRGSKVAHMPGANWRALMAADADYERLTRRCEHLALALAKGQHLEITSFDKERGAHFLTAQLAPWERLPVISDGIIQDGAWGNVPSGETFIAPLEDTAEGEIVINGSLPGMVLTPPQELVLEFRQGRLVRLSPSDSAAARHLQKTVLDSAQQRGDPNWSNLAEIGLGVNPQIRRLTGIPLLDEKKYGTLHIALGDSTDMGGSVSSLIHCDMVCLKPRVCVDGKAIMEQGKVVFKPADWREDHRNGNSADAPARACIGLTSIEARIDKQGELRRQWHTATGRVDSVPVGSEASAQKAARVWHTLRENGGMLDLDSLTERLTHAEANRMQRKEVWQLVQLLETYGLVQPKPVDCDSDVLSGRRS